MRIKRSVWILVPSLLVGGAEAVSIELANGLADLGWRVRVVTQSADGPLGERLNRSVELHDFGCLHYHRLVFKLAASFDRDRPDIVLTTLYATGIAALAARSLAHYKPKIVLGAHNSLRAKIARPDNIKDRFLLGPLSRLLFPGADAIVPVSAGVGKELQTTLHLNPARITVIHNPVVSSDLFAKASEDVVHPWLQAKPARAFRTIVAVGRLVEQKGFDVLLDAMPRVLGQVDCRLILLGDGPQRGALEAQADRSAIGDKIDFRGLELNPFKFMSRANLFVLSSRWEGLANVLIEAMACGCPVVATDCEFGPREILQGETYGILAPVGDAEGLAATIVRALNGKPLPVDEARARAMDFSVEKSVSRYAALFSNLLSNAEQM